MSNDAESHPSAIGLSPVASSVWLGLRLGLRLGFGGEGEGASVRRGWARARARSWRGPIRARDRARLQAWVHASGLGLVLGSMGCDLRHQLRQRREHEHKRRSLGPRGTPHCGQYDARDAGHHSERTECQRAHAGRVQSRFERAEALLAGVRAQPKQDYEKQPTQWS